MGRVLHRVSACANEPCRVPTLLGECVVENHAALPLSLVGQDEVVVQDNVRVDDKWAIGHLEQKSLKPEGGKLLLEAHERVPDPEAPTQLLKVVGKLRRRVRSGRRGPHVRAPR